MGKHSIEAANARKGRKIWLTPGKRPKTTKSDTDSYPIVIDPAKKD